MSAAPAIDPITFEVVRNKLAAITDLVTTLRADHEVTAVGVGAAGYVDSSRSVVMFAPNLAIEDLDLRADLEARIGLPVVVTSGTWLPGTTAVAS